MTHRGVDLSIIGSENRRMTHAGIPAGPVRSDLVSPAPVPVREKPYRLQLCGISSVLTVTTSFGELFEFLLNKKK
jgi:hypothetical protein